MSSDGWWWGDYFRGLGRYDMHSIHVVEFEYDVLFFIILKFKGIGHTGHVW